MKENNLEFVVKYKGKSYTFDTGSKVYFFHVGIYNELDKRYGIKGLIEYVSAVHECYMSDDGNTALGALADYIAQNWRKMRLMNEHGILDKFYTYTGGF